MLSEHLLSGWAKGERGRGGGVGLAVSTLPEHLSGVFQYTCLTLTGETESEERTASAQGQG